MTFQKANQTWSRVAALLAIAALASTAVADDKEKDADKKPVAVKIKDITLTVPADWKRERASNRLRLAQFVIPVAKDDKETGELVVYSFGGGGGGVDANIKRWISQFANEGRKAEVTKGTSAQGKYVVADISGTYNKPIGPPIRRQTKPTPGYRMLAVILTIEGKGNYFLKLTAPAKTAAAAEKALRASFGADKKKESEYEIE
jgi:gluconolactonase